MAIDIKAINQALYDYADYQEVGSVTRAQTFLTAVRRAIALRPSDTNRGGQGDQIRYDLATLREFYSEVNAWISKNDVKSTGGFHYRGTNHCSTEIV